MEINKGYPAIKVRVFKDENGDKDVETQKLVSQYMMNWQEKTEEYNGRMGITARIPDFFQAIDKSCPKWSQQEIDNICNYIEKYKVIPTLRYAPEEFNLYTKQVWWLAPFVLWNSNSGEVASWLFIDKNGFYAAHPSDNEGALIFHWDIITNIDLDDYTSDELVTLTLYGKHNGNDIELTFSEFAAYDADENYGNGSYLSVIPKIYEAYKKTIEVSDNTWFHGAGGEGYQGFDNSGDLLKEEVWKTADYPNPSFFGYSPPKIEPKICPELKTFFLKNTECSVPPFNEWKLNEYIDMLLDSPAAKPLFWKNEDGIYLMFPKPGLLISADTDEKEEIDFLKFLGSNVPNKHFDFGYTQSHKKEDNSWYEKTYDILIANNFETVDGKINIGKVTVTTDEEIDIIAQVFLKRGGLEWYIEGEENKGEYIKYDSGISYQGEAKGEEGNRIPHGKGVMTVPDGPVITGDFKEGLVDGYAKMDFLDGEVYEGEFKENKKHGKGVYVWPSGNDRQQYTGEYKNGLYEGEGIMTYYDGTKYEGSFKEDKRTGHGKLTYSDGASYKGYFENGEWEGGVDSYDEVNLTEEENAASYGRYTSTKNFTFYGLYNNDQQRTIHGTITTPDKVEINLKDCEKYKDKGLTDAYTSMKNTYGSHTFEYDDTDNGILSFERASEIFGNFTNEDELSFEMDRVYGLKINSLEGFIILHADDNEIKKALAEERDIESNVIIKSDNMQFIEILVEILKLNNRDKDSDNANKDTLQFDIEFKETETIEEKKEVNKEFWWDEINDYVISKIKQENESIDEYLGHLQILFIDEWDVEDEVEGAMRYHNKVTLEDLDKLDPWIGKEEVKKWKMDWESLSVDEKKNTHETALYMSTDEGYEYLTHLTIDKENFIEQLDIDTEEVREEIAIKDDIDSIQSFRSFMKEKFPSLKLPKNKPYAGIDLKDGYSINFHVQKKALVLSFRSVKTDPEEIMRILNDKGLNGKDIGDGHVLKAEPGKRNPSIITMNIEIPYSSKEELASDALRENVRSYFEKFSELFDLNK